MQLANVMVKLGGDNNNIIPKLAVTPAEILVLRAIHGSDCVVDVRPHGERSRKTHQQEYDRLAATYDAGAGSFTSEAGEERKSVMERLFPGALKRLPTTLEEIGAAVPAAVAPEPLPNLPDLELDEAAPEVDAELEVDAEPDPEPVEDDDAASEISAAAGGDPA